MCRRRRPTPATQSSATTTRTTIIEDTFRFFSAFPPPHLDPHSTERRMLSVECGSRSSCYHRSRSLVRPMRNRPQPSYHRSRSLVPMRSGRQPRSFEKSRISRMVSRRRSPMSSRVGMQESVLEGFGNTSVPDWEKNGRSLPFCFSSWGGRETGDLRRPKSDLRGRETASTQTLTLSSPRPL